MKNQPKVLLLGIDPFNRTNATGITLSNLFEGWDKDNIAQVYFSDKIPTIDVCHKYFKLPNHTVFVDYYFRKIISFFKNHQIATSSFNSLSINSKKKNLKNIIRLNLRAALDLSPLILSSDLFDWMKRFNPDIIYSTLGSCRMVNLANRIAAHLNKPFVPHFMDDWVSTIYAQNELGGVAKKYFEKKLAEVIKKSNGGLCISEPMVEEYTKRYGLEFSPFVNCIDDVLFSYPAEDTNNKFIIQYIGGLHLDRWRSILDVAKAVDKLNDVGKKVSLHIYCPSEHSILFSHYFNSLIHTEFKGYICSDKVSQVLKEASLLLHVESFDENYIHYTKFSLSTKIPQYLAAGKPVLGYGPDVLASMKHLVKTNSGEVISKNNCDDIYLAIEKLIHNKDLLMSYAVNGFTYAKQNHSKSYNHKQLKSVLEAYS